MADTTGYQGAGNSSVFAAPNVQGTSVVLHAHPDDGAASQYLQPSQYQPSQYQPSHSSIYSASGPRQTQPAIDPRQTHMSQATPHRSSLEENTPGLKEDDALLGTTGDDLAAPVTNRGCTDVFCLVLFFLYVVGILVVVHVSVDVFSFFEVRDRDGFKCGQGEVLWNRYCIRRGMDSVQEGVLFSTLSRGNWNGDEVDDSSIVATDPGAAAQVATDDRPASNTGAVVVPAAKKPPPKKFVEEEHNICPPYKFDIWPRDML